MFHTWMNGCSASMVDRARSFLPQQNQRGAGFVADADAQLFQLHARYGMNAGLFDLIRFSYSGAVRGNHGTWLAARDMATLYHRLKERKRGAQRFTYTTALSRQT